MFHVSIGRERYLELLWSTYVFDRGALGIEYDSDLAFKPGEYVAENLGWQTDLKQAGDLPQIVDRKMLRVRCPDV